MLYIKDDTDLGSIKENQKVNDFKKELNDSLMCSDSKKPRKVTDAKKKCKTKSHTRCRNVAYMLASTSGKEINNRQYEDADYQRQIMERDWHVPYDRPVLRNHDSYSGNPVGRVKDGWYISHATKTKLLGNDELPEDVLEFFKDHHCFDDGIGSTILKVSLDDETHERVKDGLDNTVSQGQFATKAVCNICGHDYLSGACEHIAGREYSTDSNDESKKVKCVPIISGLEPSEISIVNVPANDTSLIYISSEPSTPALDSQDAKEENKKMEEIDKKTETCNDDTTIENKIASNEEKTVEEDQQKQKKGDVMFKDLLKKAMADSLNASEKVIESFNSLFDKLETEEQITALKDFLDAHQETMIHEKETPASAEDSKEVEPTVTPEPKTEVLVEDTKEETKLEENPQDFHEEQSEIEDQVKVENVAEQIKPKTLKTFDSLINDKFIQNNL